MKRMVQENIKKQKHQTFVKNLMLTSAKTVSSNIVPVVNQKANILYISDESSFFWFVFCFQSFSINILPVLKSVDFTWREQWVMAVQTVLW